jgi:L-arabinokinase
VTDYEQKQAGAPHDRLRRLATDDLASAGMRYEDVVAAADVVVSKPGYGIVSECIANGAALLYTSRDRFREYDVFVEQMPSLVRSRYVSPEDFRAGRWKDGVEQLLMQTAPDQPDVNGADVAADAVLAFIP